MLLILRTKRTSRSSGVLARPFSLAVVWAVSWAVAAALALTAGCSSVRGQDLLPNPASQASDPSDRTPAGSDAEAEQETVFPERVEIRPGAGDAEIASRLQRILDATDWFEEPAVRVEEGVAFLSGRTETEALKKWAGDLGRNTRDVVAVVNRIQVAVPPLWDLTPALNGLQGLWRAFLRTLPLLMFGAAVILVAWFAAHGVTRLLLGSLKQRGSLTPLLRNVAARAAGAAVFLLGLYLVLLVIGLARLAVTVLGGTGLIGLIIGIAFRDITENFLASIFLSVQRPFRTGDLIQVADITGLVQRLTVRTTVLMTLDGNHVQVPNSTVYKSTIRNYTSNPNRREDFVLGIGYDDNTAEAQEIAMGVLTTHPAVLREPEPWVLVDNLGPSTVNLRIYFWLDGTQHSWLKVRSSVIRLVKRAFQEGGISMPDEAREVIVSREVPVSVRLLPGEPEGGARAAGTEAAEATKAAGRAERGGKTATESDAVSTKAEAGLSSDAGTVEEQARKSRTPEPGNDLLNPSGDG